MAHLRKSQVHGAPREVLGVAGLGQRVLVVDLAVLEKLDQTAVQGLHSQVGAGLNVQIQLVGFAVPNQGSDGGSRRHHLEGCNPAFAVPGGQQGLGDDRL